MARYSDPSSPCSSAVTNAKIRLRRGGAAVAARAMVSTVAHPEALSSAPLKIPSVAGGTGVTAPRWSWCAV